jgi:hypothetical protein
MSLRHRDQSQSRWGGDPVVHDMEPRGNGSCVRRYGGRTRVERVREPYDFVIHAAGPGQVEVIEGLAGASKSESVSTVPSLTRRYRLT